MKAKLHEYIDTIFADAERRAPHSKQLAELKEEMFQNLNDKYDDLIASGKTPAAAYNIAIAGVGDVSDLLDSVVGAADKNEAVGLSHGKSRTTSKAPLTPEQEEELRRYRSRSAILTAISIAMYILCIVPPIIFQDDIFGPVLMFAMIAIATALIIFNNMSKPKFAGRVDRKDDDDDDEDENDGNNHNRPRRSPVYKAISAALWTLGVCAYLLVSFVTGYWHITWMIFLILAAIDNIIKAIFDIRR